MRDPRDRRDRPPIFSCAPSLMAPQCTFGEKRLTVSAATVSDGCRDPSNHGAGPLAARAGPSLTSPLAETTADPLLRGDRRTEPGQDPAPPSASRPALPRGEPRSRRARLIRGSACPDRRRARPARRDQMTARAGRRRAGPARPRPGAPSRGAPTSGRCSSNVRPHDLEVEAGRPTSASRARRPSNASPGINPAGRQERPIHPARRNETTSCQRRRRLTTAKRRRGTRAARLGAPPPPQGRSTWSGARRRRER